MVVEGGGDLFGSVADTEDNGAGVLEKHLEKSSDPGKSPESEEDMGSAALPTTLMQPSMQESPPPPTAAVVVPKPANPPGNKPVIHEGGAAKVNAASVHVQYKLREYRFKRTSVCVLISTGCVLISTGFCTDQYRVCTDQYSILY